MSDRENRREEILEAAGDLFVRHGYAGTSTRNIADVVGCTKAALYYHFKEGKEEIYDEVLKTRGPNLGRLLDECENAESLQALILCFTTNMVNLAPELFHRLRWVMAEFPNFTETMRQEMRDKHLLLLREFTTLIERFVDSHEEAVRIAMLTIAAMIGYQHLFAQIGTEDAPGSTVEDYMQFLAKSIAGQ